ncbi:MAG: hypothetical protein R8M45_11575 [Ghiorsea sp.]
MTPQGAGLFRYVANGGETIRQVDKYPTEGRSLVAPTSAYFAGETIEILLDYGYTVLDTSREIKTFAPRATSGRAHQQGVNSRTVYKLQIQGITDVRGVSETSELVAFQTMMDACSQGGVLFWYPDFINLPDEVIACRVSKPTRAGRAGHTWVQDITLRPILGGAPAPAPFWEDRYYMDLTRFGNPVNTSPTGGGVDPALTPPALVGEGVRSTGAQAFGFEFNQIAGTPMVIGRWRFTAYDNADLRVDLYDTVYPSSIIQFRVRAQIPTFDITAKNHIHVRYDPAGATDLDKITVDLNGARLSMFVTIGGVPTTLTPIPAWYEAWTTEVQLEAITNGVPRSINNMYQFDGAAPLVGSVSGIKDLSPLPNLFSWYRLENNLLDSSGNGRHLTARDINAADGFVAGSI